MVVKPSSRWKYLQENSSYNEKLESIRIELRKAGREIQNMYEGDPVIFGFSNQSLSETLVDAARRGWHMYGGMTPWRKELRKAISDFERRYRNVDYSPDDIIIAPGVAGAFQILHNTLLDEGDEIVAVEPSYYLKGSASYLRCFGAKVIESSSDEMKDWEPDLDELRRKIGKKTKAISIVHPNNPTGVVYNSQMLKGIVDIAGEYDVPIISDEIYGLIVFDGIKSSSIAEIAEDVPVIVLSGISKAFMRTGWRVGYLCFHDPQDKISEVKKVALQVAQINGGLTYCIPTPILYAATKALQGSIGACKDMIRELENRRDFTWRRLNEIEGVSCTKPMGTLFAFPRLDRIGKLWKTDGDFVVDLLKNEAVEFIAGSHYGKSGAGHFRTLLLPEREILEDVYSRLERFLKRHLKQCGG